MKRLILIFWSLALTLPALAGQPLDRVIASVNNLAITQFDLNQKVETQLRIKGLKPNSPERKALEEAELMELIQNALLLDYALQVGITISEEELDQEVQRFMARQRMNQAAFEVWLEKQGSSLDDFKNNLKEQILRQRVLQREIVSKIQPSEEDFRKFYESLPPTETTVRARHILILVSENAPQSTVDQALTHILKIREDILQKRISFENAATTYSADPSAQQNKGDLGFFKAGLMVEAFAQTAFSSKIGEISYPIRTQFGFHIIQVLERKDEPKAPLEEDQRRYQQLLFQQQFAAQKEKLLKKLRSNVIIRNRLDS